MNIKASGIAMMIVCVSLASMSAGASDFTLEIFGNANTDDTIDELDIEYVQGILDGTNEETELADANYDGNIDEKDIAQIELIIDGDEKELTLIDNFGRVVTVNKPIQRIVTLNYRYPELLIAIGAKGKIVGVEERFKTRMGDIAEACDMMDISVSGTSTEPYYETILELEPDIIIAPQNMVESGILAEKLPDIPAIGISTDPEEIIPNFRLLGMIVDEEDRAANLIDFMQSFDGIIEERTKELNSDEMPTFYLEGPMDYTIYAPSGSPGDMFEGIGGRNIASEIDTPSFGSVAVSSEWVLATNPDILIKRADFLGLDATEEDAEKALNEFIGRSSWREFSSAVKNEKVYLLEGDLIFTPRYLAGRCYLAKWFQPELFEDLDPEEILREYHEEFMGIEYRGIWAYSQTK